MIDGSKALRKAIEKVFGQRHPIQRCRNHKLRNVLGHLPKDQHPQVKAAFRAAMKLDAKQGEQKLEQLARWLERDHPVGLGQRTRRPAARCSAWTTGYGLTRRRLDLCLGFRFP